MKHFFYLSISSFIMLGLLSFTPIKDKLVASKSHIKFFSSTPVEDIEANNYKSVGTLNPETGDVVFSVPMQSFEFKKSLMQKHFNQDKFLDTKVHPKAKLIGKISNLNSINFSKDGVYNAIVSGEMTIKGSTRPFNTNGTITIHGDETKVNSKFNITLSEYGIEFVKGKPSKNISKVVEVTIDATFTAE